MSRKARPVRLLPVVILVLLALLIIPKDTHEEVIVLLARHRSFAYGILLLAMAADALFLIISWRKRFRAPYFFARENAQKNMVIAVRILFLLVLVMGLVFLLTRFWS